MAKLTVQDVLARFQGKAARSGKGWSVRCPAHDDKTPSLSVWVNSENGDICFNCHRGCKTADIAAALHIEPKDLLGERHSNGAGHKRIIAEYDYRDKSGQLVCQAVRYEPKDFRQRRPDGANGWIWNLQGVERPLFRLPELIAANPSEPVFIPEGEADAETLRAWGLVATCNIGGAGKWRKEYSACLRNRTVIVLPDNDPPAELDPNTGKLKPGFVGQKHAVTVYESVRSGAAVRILALPNLPTRGDVSDWKRAGGTKDELLRMVEGLLLVPDIEFTQRVSRYKRLIGDPDFKGDPAEALRLGAEPVPMPEVEQTKDSKATEGQTQTYLRLDRSRLGRIVIDFGLLKKLSDQTILAWRALLQANTEKPIYFKHGSGLAKVNIDEGEPEIQELGPNRMRCELDLVADWRRNGDDAKPPMDTVENVLVWPDQPLPRLRGLTRVPVFGPAGTLQTEPGYHSDSGLYYQPTRNLTCRPVPDRPLLDDVERALALVNEMIQDFPFADDDGASRAHAIGLFLLPFCRELIPGPTPLHLFNGNKEGVGKSKLMRCLLYPALGAHISYMSEPTPHREDAFETNLTTKILEGRGAIVLDNLKRPLDSGLLCTALTEPEWTGRLMYVNRSANIPIRAIWAATGNNARATGEMARRTIECYLSSRDENPSARNDFRHEKLEEWVERQRVNLIYAAHVLIRNWIVNGKQPFTGPSIGSYPAWSAVIGGILQVSGVTGFLTNWAKSNERLNESAEAWRELCRQWLTRFPRTEASVSPVTVADLLPIAASLDALNLTGTDDKGRGRSLGRRLGAVANQVFELADNFGEIIKVQIIKGSMVSGIGHWILRVVPD